MASRLIFQSVETRIQIAAFCAVALLVQFAAPRWFDRRRGGSGRFAFLWNAAAASIAIMITRVALEGVPQKVLTVIGSIRA